MTTYEFDRNGGPLKEDYQHFYNRINNLQDMIISYCRYGKLYSLLPYGIVAEESPKILRVTFDEAKAKRYETQTEHFFLRRYPKAETGIPKPKFAVTFEIGYCFGVTEIRTFDFRSWNDDDLKKFCRELKEHRDETFRNAYDPIDRRKNCYLPLAKGGERPPKT